MTRKTGMVVGIAAALAVSAAAYAGAQGVLDVRAMDDPAISGADFLRVSNVAAQPPPGAPTSFADIFEQVSPAVVSIDVTSQVEIGRGGGFDFGAIPPGLLPPELEEEFRNQQEDEDEDEDARPRTREARAEGSGFFISADGYIVTNNHVVEDAEEIIVTLKDETELTATVVGTDPSTDLAVIKVEGEGYPFVSFENAAKPRVGDWVIAIGNPFGLGGTATVGIISAEGRRTPDESSTFVDFLQVDAAINSGNSGGPTFDVYGRVIGVNSSILSPSGGSVGIGFAIPAEIAEQVTQQLIAEGSITRGFLGARVLPFVEEYAEGMNLDYGEYDGGAFIVSVTDDGPAKGAGVRGGDVVLSINGRDVEDQTALTRMVASSRVGENLRLEVLREGRIQEINVRSGVRPSERELVEVPPVLQPQSRRPSDEETGPKTTVETSLGLTLGLLDEAARKRYGIPEDIQGVVIEGVDRGADAVRGLRPGDVITMAAGAQVEDPRDVVSAIDTLRGADRENILIMLQRGPEVAPLLIELEEG